MKKLVTVLSSIALLTVTTSAQAGKTNRYTPEIERAYAGRAVWGFVEKHCKDELNVNFDALIELEKQTGLSDSDRPDLETTERALQAVYQHMADVGVKRGMRRITDTNKCLLVLHTFGPKGAWIKGLVTEKE